ncbi:hypothetical protein BC941DRAFT_408642 [Chlamydoabsidia padenii]|nr:hypothetical protein BC941DRAFT_408642 [Chlamydoabsidia padenii]
MKDGFRRFEIEPLEDTLDFLGPTPSSESIKLLEGIVRLSLSRPTKIRSIAVKFKGFGCVTIKGKSNKNVGLVTPMLPKLKCSIAGKTLLPAGDHTIPWDLEIPNIYPPTLLIKRATIYYRVEVVISFALAKSITAEHPITLRRHLLPCKELAPMVETKIYEHTVPAKFHYEIEAPQIICLDQLELPFAVKYLCIANQKAVQSIRTQLTQIELYRIQSVSKTDANLTQAPMDVYNLEKKVLDCKQRRDYAKFVKRTIPALIHSVDQTRSSAWKQPIVLRHKLHQFLQHSFDSPLVSVHHQLEVTFQFDHRFEDIKAKIPIIIASIPTSTQTALASTLASSSSSKLTSSALQQLAPTSSLSSSSATNPIKASQQQQGGFWLSESDSKYPFESVNRLESVAVVPEKTKWPTRRASEDLHSRGGASGTPLDLERSQHGTMQQRQQPLSNSTTVDNPTWSSALRLPQSTIQKSKVAAAAGARATGKFFGGRKSSDGFSDKHRRPLLYMETIDSNDPASSSTSNLFGRKKPIKRYNSDYDLNDLTKSTNDVPEDQPRKTATTLRQLNEGFDKWRHNNGDRRWRPLPPIDVELANGIKPTSKLAEKSIKNLTSKSGVLPRERDRVIARSGSNHDITQTGHQSDNDDGSSDDDDDFDFHSVYSDLSLTSPIAPNPSESATERSGTSNYTLLTRPPSPTYQAAPGLPANTALRSHEEQLSSLVEESFNYASISSPVIATVASSILLSPSNSNASTATSSTTRRRITLSSVSSIMNGDTMSFRSFGGPYQQHRISNGSGLATLISSSTSYRTPYASAIRESAALEPDDYNYGLLKDNMDDSSITKEVPPAIDPKQHYLHAKLPPIPNVTTDTSSSLTTTTVTEATSEINLTTPILSPPGVVIPRIRKNKNTNNNENCQNSPTEFTVLNETKRMTRLYVDDSDDETLDPLPPIPEKHASIGLTTEGDNRKPGRHIMAQMSTSPSSAYISGSVQQWASSILDNVTAPAPQLPRLSFGMALGDALGFDQFPNGK